MSNYIFSALNENYNPPVENAFYFFSDKNIFEAAGTWPDNYIEVSDEVYAHFNEQPPEGKMIGSDGKGNPCWVDTPPLSKEQLVSNAEAKKTFLMNDAGNKIAPLQDAVDLEIATDDEKAQLAQWKKYRVLLNRVDTSTAPNISWPDSPSS